MCLCLGEVTVMHSALADFFASLFEYPFVLMKKSLHLFLSLLCSLLLFSVDFVFLSWWIQKWVFCIHRHSAVKAACPQSLLILWALDRILVTIKPSSV